MVYIVTQHFGLNRNILLLLGLWPYQRSKLVQLQTILYLGILISFVVYQLAVFVFVDCTLDLIFKVLSIALFCSVYVIEYNSFRVNDQTMRWSLEQLQCICNELKDEKEIDIMRKFGDNARRYTTILVLLHISSIIAISLIPLLLYIFCVLNEYDVSHVMMLPKHFVGRENYFYLILLHSYATVCIGGTVLIATGMMITAYVKYTCGMFRIASYRIEKAMMVNMLKNISLKNGTMMYKDIIYAIDIHQKATKFTTLFFSGFQQLHIVLVIVVITLSLNLYGISDTLFGDDIEAFVVHSVITAVMFIYLFLANYAGQEFIDHNNYVFSTVYNVQWYIAPLHVQKLILFLLRRGNKTVSLNVGIIFVLSLELFATLLKVSISYFTVVCSLHAKI